MVTSVLHVLTHAVSSYHNLGGVNHNPQGAAIHMTPCGFGCGCQEASVACNRVHGVLLAGMPILEFR